MSNLLDTPKFSVGDNVKEKGQPDSEGGPVTKMKYDSDKGWSYVFATKEVSLVTKQIIEGYKVATEAELEKIKDVK